MFHVELEVLGGLSHILTRSKTNISRGGVMESPYPDYIPGQSKYKPEYVQMLKDYFDENINGALHQSPGIDAGGSEYYTQQVLKFPSVYGFAANIGVSDATVIGWANNRDDDGNLKHPEFHDVYKSCISRLKALFVEASATGAMKNGNILAANLFGWYSDKTKVDQKNEHGVTDKMVAHLKKVSDIDKAQAHDFYTSVIKGEE